MIGPNVVNEARFSYARGVNDGTQDPFGEDGNAQIGSEACPTIRASSAASSASTSSGHIRLGSPNFMPKFQHTDQIQYLNTLTWLRGGHQLKFGADVMAPMNNEYFDVAPTRGNLTFNGQFTGNAFADFMLGYVQRAQLTNVFVVNQQLRSTSFYVQDDWKVERRADAEPRHALRLHDAGVPKPTTTWRTSIRPAPARWCSRTTGRSRIARWSSRTRTTSRRGSARSTSSPTARSCAAATACSTTSSSASARKISSRSTRPGCATSTSGRGRQPPAPILRMQDGFPPNFLDPANIDVAASMLRASDRNSPRTMVQQFGGGIERQIGDDFVASADFVGSMTDHLAVLRNINQTTAGHARRQRAAAVPDLRQRPVARDDRRGELQRDGPVVREAVHARATATACLYTFGSARDQAPEHLNASSGRPQNGRDLRVVGRAERLRHPSPARRPTSSPSCRSARGSRTLQDGVAGKILGGWLVSGIYSARTGRPFTVTQGNNNVGAGATGLPNLTGDPKGAETVEQWFNPAAFTQRHVGHVRQRRPQHPARTRLGDVRHERAAPDRLHRSHERDAAVGHLQHVQPGELRPARQQHRQRDGGVISDSRRRSEGHAVVAEIWVLGSKVLGF